MDLVSFTHDNKDGFFDQWVISINKIDIKGTSKDYFFYFNSYAIQYFMC